MATAKKTASKAPKGSGKSTALVPWTEKFGQYARQSTEQVKDIGGSGIGVSFGHNDITVAGKSVGKSFEVIILGSTPHNRYFKSQYNKDDRQPPDCYAFAPLDPEHPGLTMPGSDPEMAPHPMVLHKESDKCASCPQNVFGTARNGNGKACGNTLRLGLLLAKDVDDADGAKSAELATAGVSPTNLKNYKKYIDTLADDHGRPPWSVVTEITSHDDKATQIRLEFRLVDEINDDGILVELERRFLKIQDELQKPYSAPVDKKKGAGAAKAVGRGAKFAGGARKGAR